MLTFLVNVISGQHHWETAIFASDEWKYITPNIELSSNWNALDFDDSGWSSSQGGFGYGDGDDGTIIDPSISVFLRKKFTIVELSKLSCAILNADYDDGYVAYLNGVEISRSYNLSEPGTFVPFDMTTTNDHEASLYDGGMPEYVLLDSILINGLLTNGENILAIQVHNVGLNSSDMSSNFFSPLG